MPITQEKVSTETFTLKTPVLTDKKRHVTCVLQVYLQRSRRNRQAGRDSPAVRDKQHGATDAVLKGAEV